MVRIALGEPVCDVLDVVELAHVQGGEGLNTEYLSHFVEIVGGLVRLVGESIDLAESVDTERLFRDHIVQILHLVLHHLAHLKHLIGSGIVLLSCSRVPSHGPDHHLHLLELVVLDALPAAGQDRLCVLEGKVVGEPVLECLVTFRIGIGIHSEIDHFLLSVRYESSQVLLSVSLNLVGEGDFSFHPFHLWRCGFSC